MTTQEELNAAAAALLQSGLDYAAAYLKAGGGGVTPPPVDPPVDPPPVDPPPVDPPPVDPPAGNDPLWDPRLDTQGVYVEKRAGAPLEVVAVWKTESGTWEPGMVPEWARQWQNNHLGGDHHVYLRCEDAAGQPLPGVHFGVLWNGPTYDQGVEIVYDVNHNGGWADFVMGGQNTNPTTPGEVGYLALAFIPDGPGSWKVHRLFMPLNHHHSFFIVWRLRAAASAEIFPASAWTTWALEGAKATALANVRMQAIIAGEDE